MRLNLNKTVKVKLTERGKELYREHFSHLPDCFEKPEPRIDEDGFTEMQLWMFMEMFGEHMSMWKPNVIEPLEIVFDTEDSESVKEQKIKLESDLISRQAAIEYIDNYAHMLTTGNYFEGMMNAVDLLKRLDLFPPVVPEPVCEDCISRADTIKAMCADCEAFFGDDTNCADCDNVAVVRGMPPVKPERPNGEWVDRDGWSYCSNCEKYATPHNNGCEIEPCHTPFCPWCGADMRGDKE